MKLTKEERAILRVALCAYDNNRRDLLAAVTAHGPKHHGAEHLPLVIDQIQKEIDAVAALHVRLIPEDL